MLKYLRKSQKRKIRGDNLAIKKTESKSEHKTVKRFSANEKLVLKFINGDNGVFYITQNKGTLNYVVYKEVNDGYEKLGTGNTPPELEKKYIKIIRKK